jgi:hypothetical protein
MLHANRKNLQKTWEYHKTEDQFTVKIAKTSEEVKALNMYVKKDGLMFFRKRK